MKKNFQFSIFPPEADQSVRRAGNFQKGFTLIELMTSVSIFAVVMIVSLGSITGIFDANRQTRSLRAVVNNLNLAMETMSKEMRYGTRYHCGEGTFEIPQNCTDPDGGTILSFLSSDSEQITYRLADTRLEKKVGDGDFEAVTAPELVLEDMKFYAVGSGTDNDLQPKVIIKLRGYAGGDKNRSNLTIQTLVSQRLVDTDPTIPYTTPYPAPPYETPSTFWDLTVTNNTTSLGTVSGPGINCGVDCEESFVNGADVPLSATPIGTNIFSGWSGDCSGASCNLIMTANKAVTATFSLPSYTIDYLVVGGGGGGGNGVTPGGAPTGQPGGGGGGGDVLSGSTSVVDGGAGMTVTVGASGLIRGGSGGQGFPGGTSIFNGVSATGGGGGGASNGADNFEKVGGSGANGGGGGGFAGAPPSAGGGGTFVGGTGNNSSAGGGGGDSQNGGNGNPTGTGGNGTTNFITGAGVVYGPGGGGGHSGSDVGGTGGSGGLGGRGAGVTNGPTSGSAYGSGGGGMNGANFDFSSGANGFQGVVILRYAGNQKGSGGTVSCIGGSPPNCVSFTLHTFTSSGTFTP